MAKKLTLNGSNAVRILLKNKEAIQADLRSEEKDDDRTTYVFDIFYEDSTGTFTIARENDRIVVAALNLNMGRVISLVNDANIRKLAEYVLETAL